MNHLSKLILFMTLFVTATSAMAEGAVTEAEAKAFMDKYEAIIEKKDVDQLNFIIADDVKIQLVTKYKGRFKRQNPDKESYIASLNKAFATRTNYSYKRQRLNTKVNGNQATATVKAKQTLVRKGVYLSSTIDGSYVLERWRNRVVIVGINLRIKTKAR